MLLERVSDDDIFPITLRTGDGAAIRAVVLCFRFRPPSPSSHVCSKHDFSTFTCTRPSFTLRPATTHSCGKRKTFFFHATSGAHLAPALPVRAAHLDLFRCCLGVRRPRSAPFSTHDARVFVGSQYMTAWLCNSTPHARRRSPLHCRARTQAPLPSYRKSSILRLYSNFFRRVAN
jgi:hypothetical protein